MKKIITTLILGATLGVWSAQAQTDVEVVTHTVAESESNNASAILDDMTQTTIKAKNDSIASLKHQVQVLEDSIKNLQYSIQCLNDTIQVAQNDRTKLKAGLGGIQKEVDKAKKDYKELADMLKAFDVSLYQQCFLLPTMVRYNPTRLPELERLVETYERLNSNPSKEFQNYKKIYLPLLKMYEKYNNELIACIEKHRKMFKMTKGIIESDHRQRCAQELHSLPYYRACYVGRNNPPYKSILYLDDIIEEYEKLLNSNGNVLDRIEDILSRLRPKQVQPEPTGE